MRINENVAHKFNLTGLSPFDWFLGCNECNWKMNKDEVAKPICPNCGNNLFVYTVTQDDFT